MTRSTTATGAGFCSPSEAGLKPRDSGKWHQLDDEIDAVLTALRAGNPSQADCTTSLTALAGTLNEFDGV